jgi:hypothetical protein
MHASSSPLCVFFLSVCQFEVENQDLTTANCHKRWDEINTGRYVGAFADTNPLFTSSCGMCVEVLCEVSLLWVQHRAPLGPALPARMLSLWHGQLCPLCQQQLIGSCLPLRLSRWLHGSMATKPTLWHGPCAGARHPCWPAVPTVHNSCLPSRLPPHPTPPQSASFSDGNGQWLDRPANEACKDTATSVYVTIADACPCHYPNNAVRPDLTCTSAMRRVMCSSC